MIVSLKYEPDTEELELVKFCFQYIVSVETKMILYFVAHHCPETTIINIQ